MATKESDFEFIPVAGQVPQVGGTHRDTLVDYEVRTPDGMARASLSSEARFAVEKLVAMGASEPEATAAFVGVFTDYVRRMVELRFQQGESTPDIRVNAADVEVMAMLITNAARHLGLE